MTDSRPVPLDLDARIHQPAPVLDHEDAAQADGSVKGYLHSTETVGSVNGPGVRYTVYLSGCPLRCLYCHNPDTWNMRMGEHIDVETVLADIGKYARFISVSGGGLTVSGGEPLLQPRFVTELFRGVRERFGMHTALDTAGSLGERASDELLSLTNLVLLDIKSGKPEAYRRVTSWELQPTLDFARRVSDAGRRMWVRYVLVPGVTDQPDNIAAVADFVTTLKGVDRVEISPYHDFGEQKYEALDWDYPLAGVEPPSKDEVKAAGDIFRDRGLLVL
ncbi:MAG: pyruvate formate-lyase-activating protein [Jiangellales bacterium]